MQGPATEYMNKAIYLSYTTKMKLLNVNRKSSSLGTVILTYIAQLGLTRQMPPL